MFTAFERDASKLAAQDAQPSLMTLAGTCHTSFALPACMQALQEKYSCTPLSSCTRHSAARQQTELPGSQ
jgi:hypothetical protein